MGGLGEGGVGGRKDQNNLGFIVWIHIISDFFDRGGSEACMTACFTAFFLCQSLKISIEIRYLIIS